MEDEGPTPTKRFADLAMRHQEQFGGGSLMIQAHILFGRRTDLTIIRSDAITGGRYRGEIIKPVVIPLVHLHRGV